MADGWHAKSDVSGDVTGIVVAGKLFDLANRTATIINDHINHTATSAVSEPPSDVGVPLSMTGGLLYAVGALIVSYAVRAQERGAAGWTDNWVRCFSVLSWMTMNTGGLCVTFAYQSGASVPLLNAIVYSTNLMLNMLLQMFFRLSVYTKMMRCGTVLFALAALQLGGLSPAPHKVDLALLGQPEASSWTGVFLCLWIFSTVLLQHTRSFPGSSGLKTMSWALHVACWGCFTDNWAKINGTFDTSSTTYWMLFVPYLAVGGLVVMVLSVSAMAITDIALYVPLQLCTQLILNLLSSFLLWGEASNVHSLMPYVAGYAICILAVYIATPEIDCFARMAEIWSPAPCCSSEEVAPVPVDASLKVSLLAADERRDVESGSEAQSMYWGVVNKMSSSHVKCVA